MESASDRQRDSALLEHRGRSSVWGFRDYIDAADQWITMSRFGKLFRLSGTGHVCLDLSA